MEIVFNSKKELYRYIANYIEKDLKENGLTTHEITIERYNISRRQFFHLKKVAENGEDHPDLSEKKIKSVIEKLHKELIIKYHVKM